MIDSFKVLWKISTEKLRLLN